MKDKIIDLLTILLPMTVVAGVLIAMCVTPESAYSLSERRMLTQKPELNRENVTNSKYMEAFEAYTLDQFPKRDSFRKLKADIDLKLFRMKDNHGYYLAEGYLSKLAFPINEKRLAQSISKQQQLYDHYLKGTDCRIYYSIIPDKNYFLASENGYPSIDYAAYVQRVQSAVAYGSYIDLFDCLCLTDYYRTDPHWRQEKLGGVVDRIREEMNMDSSEERTYNEHTVETPFYGAYYGKTAWDVPADQLVYLTSDEMKDWTVTSYNTGTIKKAFLYDMDKAAGRDPYEMFLNGSDALLTIENPHAENGRELLVFRDSFGSSLVPLLADAYEKVTLIDLRYIRSEVLGQYVTFDNQDVLFIYSTLVF